MNVLIIGGVAAGTKAAAKLKREKRDWNVTLITKDQDISYAGCGLPYYVGGLIQNKESLIVNTPAKFSNLTDVKVLTGREAIALDAASKTVTAKNLQSGLEETYQYDELIIATGASSVIPPIPGAEKQGIFKMRVPDDAIAIRDYIQTNDVKNAVIVGAGFIGLEAAENLYAQGVTVTMIEMADQILPNVFDKEMALYVKRHLTKKGIRIFTNTKAEAFLGDEQVQAVQISSGVLNAEVVILSAGIRPNTAFLEGSGLNMTKGTLVVDEHLQTNLPHVYAVGDCAMVTNRITSKAQWSPMGSSANMEGRTLAQILAGADKEYKGVLGTGIVKLPELNCGRTGLTEAQAKAEGYDVITALTVTDDKAHYYPDSAFISIKLIADKSTHRLLGAQIIGPGAVDKMTDIAVLGIAMNARLEDFENMDFAYAPPFSTAIHPFVQAVYVQQNKLNGELISITPAEYLEGKAKDYRVIDVSKKPTIYGAFYVNLEKVEGPIEGLDKNEKLLLVCTRGKRAYFLQNKLRHYGYSNTLVLEGATSFNEVKVSNVQSAISPEDVARVKALGFLRDKLTPDCFNGRVITRNGKIPPAAA